MGTETETVVSVFLPAAQRETLNELEFRKCGESEGVDRTVPWNDVLVDEMHAFFKYMSNR